MKFTKGKYETIIESTITRFEQGGLLSGDLVRFRKDAMKNEKVKAMMDNYKAQIEDAINTDLNLRVSAIKSIRPTTTGNYGGGHNAGTRSPTDHFVDIVVEYAPGLWRNPITVPIEVLEMVDTNGNLAPVPDSLKRKSKIHGTEKAESPDADRSLATKNKKPEFEKKTTDGRSQIKKAVEVKKKNQGKLTLEDVYTSMYQTEKSYNPAEYWGTIDTEHGSLGGWSLSAFRNWYKEKFGEDPYQKTSSATMPEEARHEYESDAQDVAYFLKNVWPKKQKEISMAYGEATEGVMMGANPGANPGTEENPITNYKVVFTQPYQATSDDLINKLLQRDEFNKDNTDPSPEWKDDKTMIIKIKGLDKDTVERGMSEVAKGIVTVTPEDELTSFGAPAKQGAVIMGTAGDSIKA